MKRFKVRRLAYGGRIFGRGYFITLDQAKQDADRALEIASTESVEILEVTEKVIDRAYQSVR